jgi:alkylated DNA repair dioxygenase AlkB
MTAPDGFTYVPHFLTAEEQQSLLTQLQALPFAHDRFRGQQLKRGYAQFGQAYVSEGRMLESAPPLPDFLIALATNGLPHCPEGTQFDQCIVTHYPEGSGIGWHTDAPRFGECILAVSLGAAARLQFRPNGTTISTHEVRPAPGSAYVMCGPARWHYQHQVVPVRAERYSLTFRRVR